MSDVTVLSLGGSLVVPDRIDVAYLRAFKEFVATYLDAHDAARLVLVVGGGRLAREYQQALREAEGQACSDDLDWMGIFATRLNARLVKAVLGELCVDPIVDDPSSVYRFSGRVLVAAGWKPGFSTDFDAVVLAEEFGASIVVNLSNIETVYTADPKIDPDAQPIDRITWSEFLTLIGEKWAPGLNSPFDPVAAKHAATIGITVVSAHGGNLDNVRSILEGGQYVGTTIGPD